MSQPYRGIAHRDMLSVTHWGRMARLRRDAGLSQAQVGALLHPPRTHAAVSDIERGATILTVDLCEQLARIYGVSPVLVAGWDAGT